MKQQNESSSIRIIHYGSEETTTSPEEMAKLAVSAFDLSERVPDAAGRAFDFHHWYEGLRKHSGIEAGIPYPSHLIVEAADTFEATIPWEQLEHAAVLFATPDGGPLPKNGPVRLYAPSGTSECLNVKSIIVFRFISGAEQGEASYGFKNKFTPDDLRKSIS